MTGTSSIPTHSLSSARIVAGQHGDHELCTTLLLVADKLSRAVVVYDPETSELAGVVYYDDGTRAYYAAPLRDVAKLARMIATDPRDAYSRWCSQTDGTPRCSEDDAARELVCEDDELEQLAVAST